jgi:hypothetical protein
MLENLEYETKSLKALLSALDRLDEPLDQLTQLEFSEWLKQLRQILPKCPPLQRYYDENLDQLIEDDIHHSRKKLIRSQLQVKHSILELEGLGKAIWQGIDAQQYVDQERDSWTG